MIGVTVAIATRLRAHNEDDEQSDDRDRGENDRGDAEVDGLLCSHPRGGLRDGAAHERAESEEETEKE